MFETKDLNTLKIIQKARAFADEDLLNENLVFDLIHKELAPLKEEDKASFIKLLNTLLQSKEKALLSSK